MPCCTKDDVKQRRKLRNIVKRNLNSFHCGLTQLDVGFVREHYGRKEIIHTFVDHRHHLTGNFMCLQNLEKTNNHISCSVLQRPFLRTLKLLAYGLHSSLPLRIDSYSRQVDAKYAVVNGPRSFSKSCVIPPTALLVINLFLFLEAVYKLRDVVHSESGSMSANTFTNAIRSVNILLICEHEHGKIQSKLRVALL